MFPLKIVDFSVGDNILWDAPRLHQITPFLSKMFQGSMPRTTPATVWLHNVTGHLHTCYVVIFLGKHLLALFKGIFEECLSEIYLLDLIEVTQAYWH